MKTEVTIHPEYYCPCCGEPELYRDCQEELFGEPRTWWCRTCGAEFSFRFTRHGLPPGGFLIVPDPNPEDSRFTEEME
ncbi:hypothetical protein LCGC14_1808390 [marine sediment metagenome]|uniref:Uncharacterized protein n=1 Tax=marine sediment metagenome TaxID=412755 RepID=A0A0F9JM54_9ZZZZ